MAVSRTYRALLASAAAALLLAGCETLSYYLQAFGGQMSLSARARPVEAALADAATPADLRQRLELARSIRDFSVRELKLPDNASYRSYAHLDRRYAVWNVVAAPEFSLDPVQSCFPVAGCVAYRGFFSQADAEKHAETLSRQGLDAFVYGVPAYSTLGRFDDPLLSTFIRFSDTELARLVFHELAHQVAYVKDDSTFNESFAVAVERVAVRRWLAATGREAQHKEFQLAQERAAELRALLDQARARLQVLYRERIAPEATRERKRAEFADLKAKLLARGAFKDQQPNNALLASFATYTQLVSNFEHLLEEEGGDLERFYARVKALAAREPADRGPFSPRR